MYRILEKLRKSEGFISGEEIGRQLQISRTAIWKGIKKLREEGYEIEAVTNKGYRLVNFETMYNEAEITNVLQTERFGKPLYFYRETDTTNARIRELAANGSPEGTLAVAECMSAGRGRRGRVWAAPAGTGTWFSVLLRPDIRPTQASTLTLLAGLATCNAINEETNAGATIKWPNDILLGGKKLVGILTEMDCEMEETNFVIVGIGINVNTQEFPEELKDIATSLYLETGRTFSRKNILQKALVEFEKLYDEFLSVDCDFSVFCSRYEENCFTIGKEVTVIGKETFLADAIGITPEGELIVKRKDNGKEEVVFSGEVSIRGGQG